MEKPQLSPEDAEASEKLFVPDGEKIVIRPPGAGAPQNGDTRIDMAEAREAFVGMGKEELMKFANDPFWVKLRLFLFVLFWFLWFGMLFGAVAIIAYAPKCSAPAERDWFEKSPLYDVNADELRDASGQQLPLSTGLLHLKDHLSRLGIKSLLLNLNLETSEDFKALPNKYGVADSLKKTLASLREAGIHTLLKFVPNHVSINHPWFKKSILKEEPYNSYFIWAKGKDGAPPSNWNSFNSGSAWTLNSERAEFYLHQANATFADFNFRNPEVVDHFSDVFKYWLDFGFCGIHLDKVAYLVEDENLDNELPSTLNIGDLGDYNFLTHSKTANLDESYDVLKKWVAVISNSSGVLSIDEVSDPSEVMAQLIQRPFVLRQNVNSTADQLKAYIMHGAKTPHQTWLLDPVSTKNVPLSNVEGISLLFMLLSDTSLFSSGLELGQKPQSILRLPPSFEDLDKTNASSQPPQNHIFSTFKKVVDLRESPSIAYGETKILPNSTLLLVTRLKSGNPGYLVALNLDASPELLNVTSVQSQVAAESLRLISSTNNFLASNQGNVSSEGILASSVVMPPTSFALMEYIATTS